MLATGRCLQLEEEETSDDAARRSTLPAVYLLDPEGDACAVRWCRQWVRTASCRFGAQCRHVTTLRLDQRAVDAEVVVPERLDRLGHIPLFGLIFGVGAQLE